MEYEFTTYSSMSFNLSKLWKFLRRIDETFGTGDNIRPPRLPNDYNIRLEEIRQIYRQMIELYIELQGGLDKIKKIGQN